ncbi:FecR domain-containing protein [Novosphingobium sp. 1949]|uniref:FecR domain-containing protein n=1 Tax=Novosphingobium organovorum TaxID=2930092 RepID=A0ABT0BBZ9_9SPHN|nr:FecR domain-containing protein [Novosphingobium organovorum]MCJ2182575.1 FecR domain-containing protein [Novosphingobium organovorum]
MIALALTAAAATTPATSGGAAKTIAPAAPDAPIHYTVKPGDTLSQLARLYLAPGHDWRDLQRLWHVANPRRLPARRVFTIPRPWLRWTPASAQVASVRGSVVFRAAGATLPSTNGTVLREGAQVTTAANSYTTLVLTNGSRVALPSNSDVTILRLRTYTLGRTIDYRFGLGRGTLDTKDTPLANPDSGFIIRTLLSLTAVRGTEYAVSLSPDATQGGTAVFEGTVAVSAPDGSATNRVPEGFGAVSQAGAAPVRLALLGAPDLTDPGRAQIDDQVSFDIAPLPGASAYRVQLANDAGFVDTFLEQDQASPHFVFDTIENGRKYIRVSAIGPGELAGMRQSYSFVRHLASVHAEAEATDDGYLFRWFGNGEGARHYRLQIYRDTLESTPVVDEVGLETSEATIRDLPAGVYLWRVGLTQTDADGTFENWTSPEKLTIADQSR